MNELALFAVVDIVQVTKRMNIKKLPNYIRLHWYFTSVYYCPVCNKEYRAKHRIYGQPPQDPSMKWELIPISNCMCMN